MRQIIMYIAMVLYRTLLSLSVVLFTSHNVGAVRRAPLGGNQTGPVVATKVGSIRGLRAEDGDYSMYMGIPYAEVDKDNPFGPAVPYPNFVSTFDAINDSSICPQIEEINHTIVGTLDCLHLNVYVPSSASAENNLAVLVWIFGGGFSLGFAGRFLYGPSFLVRHDVILVTLNYRLGPYGFMCLDTPEVPGNQGLKDQVLALRWIKKNIAGFGGDDTKITIAGNSAGAMSVDLHLYRCGAEEFLFHKIIPQSGVALISRSVGSADPTAPLKLAQYFNQTPKDLQGALSFLATVETDQLIAATNEIKLVFSPCIEKEFDNVEHFITEFPVNADIPRVKNIEVLIGFNNDEMYAKFSFIPDISFEHRDFVGTSLSYNFNFKGEDVLLAELKEIVAHFYFGDEVINAELKQQVKDMSADFFFYYPILRTVKKYLDNGVETIYLYLFSYSGARNFVKHRLNLKGGGAAHADELGYLFDISYMEKPLDPEDQLIVDRMTEMWANFVKYGNPTPEPTKLVPLTWPSVTRERCHYLELDSQLHISTRPFHDRCAFLDFFYKLNEEYQIGYKKETQPSAGRNIVLDISLPLLFAVKYFL